MPAQWAMDDVYDVRWYGIGGDAETAGIMTSNKS
jgi:hypothetical protein